jgi:hypothetical protein
MGLTVSEISLRAANDFVALHHRHNVPVRGHKFSLGAYDSAGRLCGVAIVARPVARPWDALKWRCEVRRTATDGTRNANSVLYGATRREAYRRGYRSVVTYTRDDEPGTSLKAAGWYPVGHRKPRAGWDAPSRPRTEVGGENIGKTVWEAW